MLGRCDAIRKRPRSWSKNTPGPPELPADLGLEVGRKPATYTRAERFRSYMPHHHDPLSTRSIARDAGFLILRQCSERPARYARSQCFETIPSSPSLQACWNIAIEERMANPTLPTLIETA